jgi:putative ABC transport system substrate-binding protein
VRLKVEILVSAGPAPTRAAKEATVTIPIVMTQDSDPVGNGFVTSLARPGGNITGLSTLAPELSGKRLELLKEINPKLSRVAVFGTSTMPGYAQSLREIELAAGAFKVQVQHLDVLGPKDIETAFRAASKERADGGLTLNSFILNSHRPQLAELAIKNRLPVMYNRPEYVEAGGLLTYGVNLLDLDRRAATYVDKILKGAKPADLPVEQPKKFEFIINLKAAKQIGLTIPPNVLVRADKVIKESAGINRHGVVDERAAQERSNAPFWLRVMRLGPRGRGRSVDRGRHRPGMELRNHHFGVPTVS